MDALEEIRSGRLFHFTRLERIAETITIEKREALKAKLRSVKKLNASLL
jgi:hypothetical protein